MHYCCLVDGACSNNGRFDAYAEGSYAIYTSDEALHPSALNERTPLVHNSRFSIPLSGRRSTNNAAEAMSLLNLVMELNRLNAFQPENVVTIYTDSELTINHFYGIYRLRDQTLKQIHSSIKRELAGNTVVLDWISGDVMKETIIGH